jgi:hypothetical protein
VIEGKIELTRRRGRRSKQLLDDLKEKRRYLKLKEEALDRTNCTLENLKENDRSEDLGVNDNIKIDIK